MFDSTENTGDENQWEHYYQTWGGYTCSEIKRKNGESLAFHFQHGNEVFFICCGGIKQFEKTQYEESLKKSGFSVATISDLKTFERFLNDNSNVLSPLFLAACDYLLQVNIRLGQ